MSEQQPPFDPAGRPTGAAPGAFPGPGGTLSGDERTLGTLAHALGVVASFVGPLIILLVARPDQRFAKYHATEALNFAITVAIASFVAFLLVFVLIGFLLLPAVGLAALVLHILAAVAANRGEWYRYPVCLRLIPDPS